MNRPPKKPPKYREAIKVNRDLLGALAGVSKRAQKRWRAAQAKHGPMSDEALAAKYGYDESERMLYLLYETVNRRLRHLETPFKRELE